MIKNLFITILLFSTFQVKDRKIDIDYTFEDTVEQVTDTTYKTLRDRTIASYYHDKLNGRETANGDIFSNNELTAAHKTLPFGTLVKVTNLSNNKSVIVEINDRGPFIKGRTIDLSKKAFMLISDKDKGIVKVKTEIIIIAERRGCKGMFTKNCK